jgi:hypothetical protein
VITNLNIGNNGRLGNQLFQYAICFAVAKELNTDFIIPEENLLHESLFVKCRLYELFNLKTKTKKKLIVDNVFKEPSNIEDNIINYDYENLIYNIPNNTSIEGWFQSYKCFIKYERELKEQLLIHENITYKAKQILEKINQKEIVNIHFRRGDYVKEYNSLFYLNDIDYINKALTYFNGDYNFFITSDDIEWCKYTFSEYKNFYFSNSSNDLLDFALMSLCNHNIISNSTFSWWAAFLNKNINKKVIMPSKWIKRDIPNKVWIKNLLLENWVII